MWIYVALGVVEITLLIGGYFIMAEIDDLNAAVAGLTTAAGAAEKALTDISAKLTALEGSGAPAPGVLEGLATQINTVATALNAAAADGEATP